MKPNVLLVSIDAARYDHFSLNGYDRRTTPNIDALATDAVTFDGAFAAAPWTPPSHASMFTGTYPSTHGYFDTGMGIDGVPTLAETLSELGYETFGTAAAAKIGPETDAAKGFDDYIPSYHIPFLPTSVDELRDYYLNLLPGYARVIINSIGMEGIPGEYINAEVIKQRIRSTRGERPFFGFAHLVPPHSSYFPPRKFRKQFETFDRDEVRMDVVRSLATLGGYEFMAGQLDPTEAEWEAVLDWYDAMIAFADELVGDLVDALERAGVYDETLVVVTADHGEHFGEHGRAYHQFSLFDELIHVPLVVKLPGGERAGSRRDDLVSHVDLAPTIYEAAGVDVPEAVEGASAFAGSERDAVFAEYGDPTTAVSALESNSPDPISSEVYDELDHGLQCIRTRTRKLIRRLDGETVLTRIDGDTETVLEDAWDDSWAELERRLDETLSDHPEGDGAPEIAEGTEENLRKMGYL